MRNDKERTQLISLLKRHYIMTSTLQNISRHLAIMRLKSSIQTQHRDKALKSLVIVGRKKERDHYL